MTDYDLSKKIDEYSEELYFDLGLTGLAEEQKADLYARIQDHLHAVILEAAIEVLRPRELQDLRSGFEQEDYRGLGRILKNHPEFAKDFDEKIKEELGKLKLTIAEEQKHAAGEGAPPV